VGVLVSLAIAVLMTVAIIQIITKAGYSPWWIVLPISTWVLWILTLVVFFSSLSFSVHHSGPLDPTGVAAGVVVLVVLGWLLSLANVVAFFVFAFSEWPVRRAARGQMPRGGRTPRPSPAGPSPVQRSEAPGGSSSFMRRSAPSLRVWRVPNVEGQPAGWHPTGSVGAGEQSYWNGEAWVAKRRWMNDGWVELPMPAAEGGASAD
jgi:hypothetical protein